MPARGPELVEFWIGRISGVGPMLRELARRYPRVVDKGRLAEALDVAAGGGTFVTYLSRLIAARLIEKNAASVRAAPALMLMRPASSAAKTDEATYFLDHYDRCALDVCERATSPDGLGRPAVPEPAIY